MARPRRGPGSRWSALVSRLPHRPSGGSRAARAARLGTCLLLGGAAACAARQSPAAAPRATASPALAIVGASVLPMTPGAGVLRDQTVLVRDGRVVALGPTAQVALPAGVERVDGRGRFVMPGLVDAHVHLEYDEDPTVLGLFLANGVTTVRSMDGRPYILEWRRRVAAGELAGPTIVTAGPLLDGDPPLRDDNAVVRDSAAGAAAVEAQAAQGYDFVKVYGNVSPAAYGAIVRAAAVHGLPVAGHIPRAVRTEGVLAARQHAIEHLGDLAAAVEAADSPFRDRYHWSKRFLGMPMDSARVVALASRMAAAGTWSVPTLVQAYRELAPADTLDVWLRAPELAHVPPAGRASWEGMVRQSTARMDADDWRLVAQGLENRRRLVRALHAAGVRLAVGTDTPNPFVVPGFAVHEELAALAAAGLPHDVVLAAATREGAALLQARPEFGTVEVGMRADLLLLAGNPLEDLGHLRQPVGVVARGTWLPAAQLAELLRRARAGGGE